MSHSIKHLLESAGTIAIIGCSAKQYRTSHHIAAYLQQNGYRIIPINPEYDEILGEKVYPTLLDVPDDVKIDIADIFRNSDHTAEMVDQIIDYHSVTGQKPAIWTQLDVSSDTGKKKAEEREFEYIENKCIMVEHEKHLG